MKTSYKKYFKEEKIKLNVKNLKQNSIYDSYRSNSEINHSKNDIEKALKFLDAKGYSLDDFLGVHGSNLDTEKLGSILDKGNFREPLDLAKDLEIAFIL